MEVISNYRTKPSNSSDSESDDSDKECTDWKRAVKKENENGTLEKVQIDEPASAPVPNCKRKRNTIWCDVLQDQMISDNLGNCGLRNKPKNYGNRGHESYDYTLRFSDPRNVQESDDRMSADDMSDESETSSVTSFDSKKFRHSKYVKLDRVELKAAKKIIQTLGEKKQYLIYRVVKMLGIDKAMTLLKMTEEVEENGGMMILNNSRRRTPGGVYFQLIKSDKNVTKEMLDKIFEGEMSGPDLKKYYDEKRKKRKECKKAIARTKAEEKAELQTPKKECEPMDDQAHAGHLPEIDQPSPEQVIGLLFDNGQPTTKQVHEENSFEMDQPSASPTLIKPEDCDLEDGEIDE